MFHHFSSNATDFPSRNELFRLGFLKKRDLQPPDHEQNKEQVKKEIRQIVLQKDIRKFENPFDGRHVIRIAFWI